MQPKPTVVPFPLTLKTLVESNNEILRLYQRTLTDQIILAGEDSMRMLGLPMEEGWTLDLGKMAFVKTEENAPSVSE